MTNTNIVNIEDLFNLIGVYHGEYKDEYIKQYQKVYGNRELISDKMLGFANMALVCYKSLLTSFQIDKAINFWRDYQALITKYSKDPNSIDQLVYEISDVNLMNAVSNKLDTVLAIHNYYEEKYNVRKKNFANEHVLQDILYEDWKMWEVEDLVKEYKIPGTDDRVDLKLGNTLVELKINPCANKYIYQIYNYGKLCNNKNLVLIAKDFNDKDIKLAKELGINLYRYVFSCELWDCDEEGNITGNHIKNNNPIDFYLQQVYIHHKTDMEKLCSIREENADELYHLIDYYNIEKEVNKVEHKIKGYFNFLRDRFTRENMISYLTRKRDTYRFVADRLDKQISYFLDKQS